MLDDQRHRGAASLPEREFHRVQECSQSVCIVGTSAINLDVRIRGADAAEGDDDEEEDAEVVA